MRSIGIALVLFAVVTACSEAEMSPSDAPSYYASAKAIVDARCVGCHQDGDIAPFALTTYDEIKAVAVPVRNAISEGTMPPWQPSDDCNTYDANIDLTVSEKETLMAWLDGGMPEGDPADAPNTPNDAQQNTFVPNHSLKLPQAYLPTRGPDDYRCQLIEWPATQTEYVTELRVTPDKRAIVHHVIVFVVGPEQVADFRAYDDAEDGPGYTCYGGPRANDRTNGNRDINAVREALGRMGLTLMDLQSGNLTEEQFLALGAELNGGMTIGFNTIGSWVPGAPTLPLPEGTGIRVEPGSMLVAQFHYNTLGAAPEADQSTIEIVTSPSVEREATNLQVLDLGWVSNGLIREPMTIRAHESNVQHSTTLAYDSVFMKRARETLGLAEGAPLVIHRASHHMHELGTSQRTEIRHADGKSSCVLDIPDWDFSWQGAYALEEPMVMRQGDSLWMSCTWDNSVANQPIIDGQPRQPVDVAWGEGTADEMCLAGLYVTAE